MTNINVLRGAKIGCVKVRFPPTNPDFTAANVTSGLRRLQPSGKRKKPTLDPASIRPMLA